MAEQDENITTIWEDYRNGVEYLQSTGLYNKIPKYVKFYEGDQWPAPTKATRNLPRPVINIVKMICRNKKATIAQVPYKIVYKSDNPFCDTEKFNEFATYIQKELHQTDLDRRAIGEGVVKGSYFYHYYWDAEARGRRGLKEGALRCELIDPLNILFSNPKELDEQKQEWIIIVSRESVKSVKAKADADVDPDSIAADVNESAYGEIEQGGDNLVTILTRYFRIDGEVYCEKGTKSVIVNKPFPLTPDVEKAMRRINDEGMRDEDAANNSLPDNAEKKDDSLRDSGKAYLYPIVAGQYDKRENSIYGLSEVEGIIPNQKTINFLLAMSALNVQNNSWAKYLVLPNALQGQVINNEPGQVIVDYSGTGNGVRKLGEQAIQSAPVNLVDTIASLTRTVTGASEVMTGETVGANMSGSAIAALQSQAQLPFEDLREAFKDVKRKQGKLLEQFYKLYYEQKEFVVVADTPDAEPIVKLFNSSEFRDVDFDISVECVSGTKASTAGDINILDVLYAKGGIDLRTYVQIYPEDAISNKSEILKSIDEREQSDIMQSQAIIQQQNQAIQQLQKQVQEQTKAVATVENLIAENNQLRQMIASMYAEARGKIQRADEQIRAGNDKITELTQDATDFATMIASGLASGGGKK